MTINRSIYHTPKDKRFIIKTLERDLRVIKAGTNISHYSEKAIQQEIIRWKRDEYARLERHEDGSLTASAVAACVGVSTNMGNFIARQYPGKKSKVAGGAWSLPENAVTWAKAELKKYGNMPKWSDAVDAVKQGCKTPDQP